jgi:ribosomal protein S27AE
MEKFFLVYTYTPWDKIQTKNLTEVRLLSLKTIYNHFPIIENKFFEDLTTKIYKYKHFFWFESIKRIVGPNNEDYDITNWNFLWAFDQKGRIFQFLFQKIKQSHKSQGILVALAPPELVQLFTKFKEKALLKTLSLLNTPTEINFLMVLGPKGKSLAEEHQLFMMNKDYTEKLKYIQSLKNIPNIQGAWFPFYSPRCPVCGEMMSELKDYSVGFKQMICPRCGYKNFK